MTPLPLEGFGVVLADPPWRFENFSEAGEEKNPVAHYPCMTMAELAPLGRAIGLDFACAPACVLVMWATFPMLREAMALMAEWGFQYKSGGAWAKTTASGKPAFGTGYIYRSAAEPWLLGVRGKPKILSHSIRNVIIAERREHSRKPDEMHRNIECQFAGPYLELFARETRPGWTAWGNETGKFGSAA